MLNLYLPRPLPGVALYLKNWQFRLNARPEVDETPLPGEGNATPFSLATGATKRNLSPNVIQRIDYWLRSNLCS